MDKYSQRQIAYAARNAQPDKERVSAEICRRFLAQRWQQDASTVLWYVHCRSEVRTLAALQQALKGGQRIVVPYCTTDERGERCLGLWRLQDVAELQPGRWNILEPPRQRWQETERCIGVHELDVVMVPGVAFDQRGARLGNGVGYYDRLLQQVRNDTVLAAVCYEVQLLPTVIMEPHDVYMDFVVTEKAIYPGIGRPGR